jgi:hypothetical protein
MHDIYRLHTFFRCWYVCSLSFSDSLPLPNKWCLINPIKVV